MYLKAGQEGKAILSCGMDMPRFGFIGYEARVSVCSHDIWITSFPNVNPNSCTELGHSYECPPGQNPTKFLTGNKNFYVHEMEVFGFEK